MKHIQIKKSLCTLLILAALLSCFPVSASAASLDIFDKDWYASHNPDVVNALGRSESALRGHYENYGKREGRAPSDVFNPVFYLSAYPDLKAAFGNNYAAAYDHFLTYGITEGRQGSAAFNLEVYKANYEDLRRAFGTSSSDNWEYIQHWAQYGRRENRNAVTRINASSASTSASSTTVKYVKTSNPANSLNLRSGPSTSYASLGKLAYGTRVEVLSESGGWSKVKANGLTGYISSQYLSSSNPSSSATATAKPASGDLGPLLPSGAYFRAASNDWGTDGKKWYGRHDINGVTTGTPIYCPANATVYYRQAATYIGSQYTLTSYGNYLDIRCDNGYRIILAHLNRFEGVSTPITATYKQSGSTKTYTRDTRKMSAGALLGYVGSTGNSSGPHLHIEVYNPSGARVDPATLFPSLAR